MHFTPESYRETPTGENIFVIGSRIFLFFFFISAHLKRLTNFAIPSLRLNLEPLPTRHAHAPAVQKARDQVKSSPTIANIQTKKKTQEQVKANPATMPQTANKAQGYARIYPKVLQKTPEAQTNMIVLQKSPEIQTNIIDPLDLPDFPLQDCHPALIQTVPQLKSQIICAVRNCSLYRNAGRLSRNLSFHEIPTDIERRKLWLQVRFSMDTKIYQFMIFLY